MDTHLTLFPVFLGHYRHSDYANGLVEHIIDAPHIKTLYDLFQNCE